MNFGKLKYRSLLMGASASMLLATSCKDFLDVDVYDQYSESSLSSKESYEALTTPLYGGMRWSQYEGKFAWCVNEGVPGVLFNVNDQEGALFRLSIGDDNSILKEGYASLYSGVIAQCNQVIKSIDEAISNGLPSGMTEADARAIQGEAYLFRGYAHFMATEYFGEVPMVWNSESDISENKTLPCVSRRTLYAGIQHDLDLAYTYLPESNTTATWRATRYSAAALLAKLNLTMASCLTATPGVTYPYVCDNPSECLNNAVKYCNEVINSGKFSLDTHKNIFAAETRNEPSSETVLALYWKMDSYGNGSAYQSQMAPSSDWSPGSGWGSGKGLTYTLYNSFTESDERKKELCFYVGTGTGNSYTTVDGQVAFYGSDYTAKKAAGEANFGSTGKEFLSSGQRVLNNIKKYVWGVNGTGVHGSGMSTDRRQDIIRLSDVYMMRAEANMMIQGYDAAAACKDASVLADVNIVLTAHNAGETLDSIMFYQDLSVKHPSHEKFTFNVTVDDGNGGSKQQSVELEAGQMGDGVAYSHGMYHKDRRVDLLQQRRKEFAMEGIAWLDLKRLYYRNPNYAESYLYQIDRSIQFANSPSFEEGDSRFENETGYERLALVNGCNAKLKEQFPDGTYTEGDPEVEIFNSTFVDRCRWYLPIPSSAKSFLQSNVLDLYEKVIDGSYPY